MIETQTNSRHESYGNERSPDGTEREMNTYSDEYGLAMPRGERGRLNAEGCNEVKV